MGGYDNIVTLLPLLIAAGVVGYIVLRVRRGASNKSTAFAWPQTMGTVLSATVQVSHHGNARQEAPLVLYTYQVNGEVFQGHRVRAGDESGRIRAPGPESSASHTVARYPSGAPVVVYYDPTNPANSALER